MVSFLLPLVVTAGEASDQTHCGCDSQCKACKEQADDNGSQDAGGGKGDQQQDPGKENGAQNPKEHGVQCCAAAGAVLDTSGGGRQNSQICYSDTEQHPIGYCGQFDGGSDLQECSDDTGQQSGDQRKDSAAAFEVTSAN